MVLALLFLSPVICASGESIAKPVHRCQHAGSSFFAAENFANSAEKRLLEKKKVFHFLLELFVVLQRTANCPGKTRDFLRVFSASLSEEFHCIQLFGVFRMLSVTRPEHEIESNSKTNEHYDDEQSMEL